VAVILLSATAVFYCYTVFITVLGIARIIYSASLILTLHIKSSII